MSSMEVKELKQQLIKKENRITELKREVDRLHREVRKYKETGSLQQCPMEWKIGE